MSHHETHDEAQSHHAEAEALADEIIHQSGHADDAHRATPTWPEPPEGEKGGPDGDDIHGVGPRDADEEAKLDALADAVVEHHKAEEPEETKNPEPIAVPEPVEVLKEETPQTDAAPAVTNSEAVYAIPYYTTPEGKIRVGFDRAGGMIGLPELSGLVMEDHTQLQPLTSETSTALSVNLGVHTNAPPLQASGDTAAERIWIDASALTRVAGSLPSLDASKPTPGYTAQANGESYILSPDQTSVMEAAMNRLDELQAKAGNKVNINIKVNQKGDDTPTPVAQALSIEHQSRVVPMNATDLAAAI